MAEFVCRAVIYHRITQISVQEEFTHTVRRRDFASAEPRRSDSSLSFVSSFFFFSPPFFFSRSWISRRCLRLETRTAEASELSLRVTLAAERAKTTPFILRFELRPGANVELFLLSFLVLFCFSFLFCCFFFVLKKALICLSLCTAAKKKEKSVRQFHFISLCQFNEKRSAVVTCLLRDLNLSARVQNTEDEGE